MPNTTLFSLTTIPAFLALQNCRLDERIKFETNDKENQAERVCENDDDNNDIDSDGMVASQNPSNHNIINNL